MNSRLQQKDIIGNYNLDRLIYRRDAIEVWEAKDQYGFTWALKILNHSFLLEPVNDILNFEIEFWRSRNLSHPHLLIPEKIDSWKNEITNNKYTYIVMTFCTKSLMQEIKERAINKSRSNGKSKMLFSEEEIAKILKEIGDAIFYLQGKGIVHKDIKPDNIFIAQNGSILEYKLADFGIIEKHSISSLRTTTILKESINESKSMGYAPPEFFRKEISISSDVFSLGVTVYELATGTIPFESEGTSLGEKLNRNSRIESLDLSSIDCATRLKLLIKACLQYRPQKRPVIQDIIKWSEHRDLKGFWPNDMEMRLDNIIKFQKSFNWKYILIPVVGIMTLIFISFLFNQYQYNKAKQLLVDGQFNEVQQTIAKTITLFNSSQVTEFETNIKLLQNRFGDIQAYNNGIGIGNEVNGGYNLVDLEGNISLSNSVSEIIYLKSNDYLLISPGSNCKYVGIKYDANTHIAQSSFDYKLIIKRNNKFEYVDCNGSINQLY